MSCMSMTFAVYDFCCRCHVLFCPLVSVFPSQHNNSFKVGAALLIGLFFYDIYFVFGTDVMMTVATKIDAPVKILVRESCHIYESCHMYESCHIYESCHTYESCLRFE